MALPLHSRQPPLKPQPLQFGFWLHQYTETALEKVINDVPIAKPNEHFQCGAFLRFKSALDSCFL